MRNLLVLFFLTLFCVNANAEFDWPEVDYDLFDNDGWTPRYAYIVDDTLIGRTHYAGLSYFKKKGPISDGITARVGFGKSGTKANLAYTNRFSFMGVDLGLTYTFLDDGNRNEYDEAIEGLGLELGLRLWVVQVIGVHMEEISYVSLAYGF